MKYKIYNYLAGFFILAVVTTSCVNDEDLVQLDPNNDAVDSFWKTDDDAIKGVNAAYGSLHAKHSIIIRLKRR
jgi:hypothetical protein